MSVSADEFLLNVESLTPRMYNYAYRSLSKASDAEDVLAEAVLSAWANKGTFRSGTNFKSWMYRILQNKIYSANRKAKLAAMARIKIEEGYKERATVNAASNDLKISDELYRALNSLTNNERDAFLLFSLGGLSYAEIGYVTEAPITTVITRLGRARNKLKSKLYNLAVPPSKFENS